MNWNIYLGNWCHLSVKIFCSRCIVKTFRDQTYKYIWRLYTKFQPNRRPGSIQWVRVKFWLLLHSKSLIRKMDESRPLLFFNFRGGLLSSIFPKKSSKCLKTAILPLKPTKVDIFSRNCHFEALRVVFGKNGRK